MILETNKVYQLKNQPTPVLVKINKMEFSVTKCPTQYVCVLAEIVSSKEELFIPVTMLKEIPQEKEKTDVPVQAA